MIITDCQMPQMSGYALARHLRLFEQQRQLPPLMILGCTANAFSAEKALCLEAGMDGVLIKPLTQRKLLAEINSCYRQVMDADSLSFDEIQALAKGNRDQEIKLLQSLLQGAVEDIDALQGQGLSPQIIAHHAHRLQGAFALLKFHSGVRLCLRVEKGQRHDAQTLILLLKQAETFLLALRLRLTAL
jgi:two-component system sensor histidine kinase EvgS